MSIFDFLRAPAQHEYATLGALRYSAGRWRGSIEIEPGKPVTLFVPGNRSAPLAEGLQLAERAGDWWRRVRPGVEKELYAHYDAGRDGGLSDLPNIATPSDVWTHVTLSSVEVRPHRSMNELQVALRTTWDDEHTLGALVRDAELVELNGSILEPR